MSSRGGRGSEYIRDERYEKSFSYGSGGGGFRAGDSNFNYG